MGKYKTIFGFEKIGYTGKERILNNTEKGYLDYSINLYEQWDPATTTALDLYNGDTTMVYAPRIDTSNVGDFGRMFYKCTNLECVPNYIINANCNSTSYMFYNCSKLRTTPAYDLTNVGIIGFMYTYCTSLKSLPKLTLTKAYNDPQWLYGCSSLTDVGGFVNYGFEYSGYTFDLSISPLTSDSVTNIANTVYDMTIKGRKMYIKFSSSVYSALTDGQKTLFTNKGWTVMSA